MTAPDRPDGKEQGRALPRRTRVFNAASMPPADDPDRVALDVRIVADARPAPKKDMPTRADLELLGFLPPRGGADGYFRPQDGAANEDMQEDEPCYKHIATRDFRKNAAVMAMLSHASNVTLDSLSVAFVIEEEMRNDLPKETVDRLVCAALLTETDNVDDFAADVDPDTALLILDLRETINDLTPELFGAASTDVQRIAVAGLCSELELIDKTIDADRILPCRVEELVSIGTFICAASEEMRANLMVAHERLLGRSAKLFNSICEKTDIPLQLAESDHVYGLFEVYQDNAPKARGPRPPRP
jgi:hypothetical protein